VRLAGSVVFEKMIEPLSRTALIILWQALKTETGQRAKESRRPAKIGFVSCRLLSLITTL
jgi:hypothetical protein